MAVRESESCDGRERKDRSTYWASLGDAREVLLQCKDVATHAPHAVLADTGDAAQATCQQQRQECRKAVEKESAGVTVHWPQQLTPSSQCRAPASGPHQWRTDPTALHDTPSHIIKEKAEHAWRRLRSNRLATLLS